MIYCAADIAVGISVSEVKAPGTAVCMTLVVRHCTCMCTLKQQQYLYYYKFSVIIKLGCITTSKSINCIPSPVGECKKYTMNKKCVQ